MNLDSEEEGHIYVGCSGGRDTIGTWKASFESAPARTTGAVLKVTGLKGGHSGLEIDKGRGNAVKIINRVILQLALWARVSPPSTVEQAQRHPPRGGSPSVSPREEMGGSSGGGRTVQPGHQRGTGVRRARSHDNARAHEEEGKGPREAAPEETLHSTLAALPHGVTKMSADIPGLSRLPRMSPW